MYDLFSAVKIQLPPYPSNFWKRFFVFYPSTLYFMLSYYLRQVLGVKFEMKIILLVSFCKKRQIYNIKGCKISKHQGSNLHPIFTLHTNSISIRSQYRRKCTLPAFKTTFQHYIVTDQAFRRQNVHIMILFVTDKISVVFS